MKGDKTVSSAVSARSLGMFREIATNVGHGLRRKGFLTIQTLNQNESSIVVGNGVKVPVVATGTFRLFLDIDCYLDLFQTLYVPSISRNLVSMSKLNLEGMAMGRAFSSTCLVPPLMGRGMPQQNGVAERRNRTLMDMVRRRKPSLRHLHVWGCPTEARIYNPHEKKLDFKTISGYFIGYPMKSKGYRFYCPNHSTKIVETSNARFIENGEIRGKSFDNVEQQINDQSLSNEIITDEPIMEEPQQSTLRRSQREHRPVISDDYVVYLQEFDYDIGTSKDSVSFSQAIGCSDFDKWIDAMNDELKLIDQNKVWELVELTERYKVVGCKWVFKTKRDSKGNIERHKAKLVAKGFTQKGELHQMDVKTTFLNGSLEEKVYMDQPEGQTSVLQLVCWTDTKVILEWIIGSCEESDEVAVHGLWLRNFISGLAIVNTIEKLLRIYCDNSAAIFFSKNDKYSNGAKHMELKYFAIKEEVQKQRVSIEHINIELMVADPLTKGLPPKTFKEHVKRMGLDCNP
ncbi:Retrovirus-related Pol polyprotein from transposon TNT 1-94 [Vitis vinifera]|uniref:Retrovirus-related Pol polyprotein from transposon TNT 1-94 n=1 Tax=Vitis vinifera TaxID=29760 RepID=A0A438FKB0_VITVI|nr:Retrovirus-related Pol polyprotein from transposon TNT 1-94 [Vitis vinifera]